MFEYDKTLRKIEEWVDKLPYRSVEIRIELPEQTLSLNKEKKAPIGFSADPK